MSKDIWSKREMRGFLGINIHYLEKRRPGFATEVQSSLISNTAECICEVFECIGKEYSIKDKLGFILSDNAANMKKAFASPSLSVFKVRLTKQMLKRSMILTFEMTCLWIT